MRRWGWALALVLALGVGLYFGIQRYRYRLVRSADDLFHLLPEDAHATRFFADVAALRKAGELGLLAGSKARQDAEYARFVRETGFDYTRDLESVAGLADGERWWLAAQGRFEWSRIRSYAAAHGGQCSSSGICAVKARDGRRWLSLRRIQPDAVAVAVAPEADAAGQIASGNNAWLMAAGAPVWLEPSPAALRDPTALPLAARIFAISLESADRLVLELVPASGSDAAFEVAIHAEFPNGAAADTARQQLERSTRLLADGFAKNGEKPTAGSLEKLLTSGVFGVQGNQLNGRWPVPRELVSALGNE